MSSPPPPSPNPGILAQLRAQKASPQGGGSPDSKPPWKVTIKRFAAYVIDHVVFFAIGFLIVEAGKFSFLERLDRNGWWLGLAITTIYFTILDSSIGKGRTFGKRLLKIEVRRLTGEFLHPIESFIRYSPFIAITVLANELRCANQVAPIVQALDILFILLVLSIPVLLFAHPLRRSVQDLVSGSIVVSAGAPIQIPHVPNRRPLVVLAIISTISGALLTAFFWYIMAHPLGKEISQLWEAIEMRSDVCCSTVLVGPFPDEDLKSENSLVIRAYLANPQESRREPEIARQIYNSLPAGLAIAKKTGQVAVTILRGYDIGIYKKIRHSTHRFPSLSKRGVHGETPPNIHYKVTPSTTQKLRMQKQAAPEPKGSQQDIKK